MIVGSPLLLAFALMLPLHLRERAPAAANAPPILVIEGMRGLAGPANIEVRAHARGAADVRISEFAILSEHTTSWRVPVDASASVLERIAADPHARIELIACGTRDEHRCVSLHADTVTLLR